MNFKSYLKSIGFNDILEMPVSTRSAIEAAEAVGCELGQIVKSLIFAKQENMAPVLILVSGKNRVDTDRVSTFCGRIIKADAEFVKKETGFSIGGVPPFGFDNKIECYVDKDLLDYELLWAAAGDGNSVFKLSSKELVLNSGGKPADIKSL